ncbi:MAG: MATE family efflux transporter [Clostridium sp.]|nr:MATE family efflux transporter [Clostridium sp.]
MKKQMNLLEDAEGKLFIRYLIPGILGMMVLSAYVFVDALCIGRALGGNGIAALNVSTPVITLFYATGFLFAAGGGASYSLYKGKGEDIKARKMFTMAISCAAVVSIIYAILGIVFIDQLAIALGATESNIQLTKEYLIAVLIFAPFFVIDILFNVFARNDKAPKVAMNATLVCCGLNVVLDILFVFGFNWGMGGAAFATALSAVVSVSIIGCYSFSKKSGLKLIKAKPTFEEFKKMIATGTSSFVNQLSVGIITILFNHTILRLIGDSGVATYGIIANMNLIFYSLFVGVANAVQPIVSENYGAGKIKRVHKFLRMGVIVTLCLGVISTIVCVAIPHSIASIFVEDVELIKSTGDAMKIFGVAYLFMGINILADAYFYSVEKSAFAITVSLSRGLVTVAIVLFVMSKVLGITGVWMTVTIAEFITAIISIVLYIKHNKVQSIDAEKIAA